MKSLLYLIKCNIKNFIKKAIRKPLALILYSVFIIFIIASIIFGNKGSSSTEMDANVIFILVNSIILITLLVNINSGLSKKIGLNFSMSDVNLIFTAPFKPQKVLIYGLIRTSGSTLLSVFFLLYQLPNLVRMTKISISQGVLLIFMYILVIFVCKIIGLLFFYISFKYEGIYHNKNKIIMALIISILIPTIYICIKDTSQIVNNLVGYFSNDFWRYIPIVGWMDTFIMIIFEGLSIYFFISVVALLALSGGIIYYIYNHEIYFYENAIEGAQKLELATSLRNKSTQKEALREKNSNKKYRFIKKKMKVNFKREFSLAIFDRHMLEYRRTGIFHVFNILSLIILASSIFVGLIFKKSSELPIILIYTWGLGVLLLFASLGGKWLQETENHYIYLIPDSSSKKLFSAMISSLYKSGLDLFIAYIVLAVLLRGSILEIVLGFIAAESFILLNNAGNAFNTVIFRKLDDILRGVLHLFSLIIYLIPTILITILISGTLSYLGNYSVYIGIIITNVFISFLMFQIGKRVFEVMEN
ncbi:putative ABC exporter domain-containing protein [Clostridium algidicarnis]|uniref:putative ABC exporter domain-containing protein n=1 Tax=Clostridium algidicarnis TaxID=37659 RepID=UPI000496F1F8|nr:putative ABC exporter domain-containing protein [Clostridium algidicarnis]